MAAEIGAAAAKIAKSVTGAEESRKLLDVAVSAGDPFALDASHNRAKRSALRQEVWTRLNEMVFGWTGLGKDYFARSFTEDLLAKMDVIPEEELVQPKGNIVGPAIIKLAHSCDQDELRELYLQLIANASDARVARSIHPSYSSFIEQLEADEAVAFRRFVACCGSQGVLGVINIQTESATSPGSTNLIVRNYLLHPHLDAGSPISESWDRWEGWVNNWMRLSLIEVTYLTSLTEKSFYSLEPAALEQVRDGREAGTWVSEFPGAISSDRGLCRLTTLGQGFARAVGINPEADETSPV